MFHFIRRNQGMALVFIVLVIISFVVFFSPDVKMSGGAGQMRLGTIDGKPVTRDQFSKARAELYAILRLSYGEDADRAIREMNLDLEQEIYNRIFLRHVIDRHKITISDAAVIRWMNESLADPETGRVDVDNLDERLRPFGFGDLERFARTELGRQQLLALFGMSGVLVTPQEAGTIYRRLNRPMATELVFFSASDYQDQVAATDEEIDEFYQKNMAAYRVPEQRRVSLVKFDSTEFFDEADEELAQRPTFEQDVETFYLRRGPDTFTDDEGTVLSAEEAKEQIKDQERRNRALVAARKRANAFIEEVMTGFGKEPDERIVERMAAEKSLNVEISEPFDFRTGPEEANLPTSVIQAAFRMSQRQPYSGSAVIADGTVYVLGLNEVIPSRMQPLAEVRDRVVKDFRESESFRLARAAGEAFQARLAGNLAEGKSFPVIVEEEGIQPLPIVFTLTSPFAPELENRPVTLSTLQSVASELHPQQPSELIPTREGGVVMFLHNYFRVDEDEMQEAFPDFIASLREQRQFAAFGQWLEEQRQQSLGIPIAPEEAVQ